MKQNYTGISLEESKKLNRSLGYVTLSNDDRFEMDYNGCFYKEKNHFATLIPDMFYDKTTRFEVTVDCLNCSIPATVVYRDDDGTGITIFELPSDVCESMNPLSVETENKIKWGDDVYLPYLVDGVTKLIPLKVCPCDGFLFINKNIDPFFGSPILNSQGKLIGLVSNVGELSEKEVLELGHLWNTTQDPIQKSKAAKEILGLSLYLASATAFDGIICTYA